MKLKFTYLILFVFCLITSCSQEDEFDFNNAFYSNANKSITADDVIGTWAIFSLEFEGQITQITADYQECGRDFIVFEENGIYLESLYEDSNCNFALTALNWSLADGIIILSNQFNQSEEIVVTKLNSTEFNFKTKLDADGDGELDIIKVFLKPYNPITKDLVSETFNRNYSEEHEDLISYEWQEYTGYDDFTSYEIYRSTGTNCSKNNAVLITTITNANTTNFTDLDPPIEENLCYFLRINIKSGVLGESYIHSIQTHNLDATPVHLSQPDAVNNAVHLNWTKSNAPYFSHYEISYSNYTADITGPGEQNVSVATITDKDITSFIDENPPYLENPIYEINVYNIFGNKTFDNPDGYVTSWEIDYRRDEIINLNRIQSYLIHPNKPIIFFLGYENIGQSPTKIHLFNYETTSIENVSTETANTSTDLPIKYFNSSQGEEILLEQGGELQVYNSNTLDFKYNLIPAGSGTIDDFLITESGLLIITDYDHIFTYSRNDNNLTLIDKKLHFTEHQSSYDYSVLEIKNDQLIVGHRNETNSILYDTDANGFLTKKNTIPINLIQNEERNVQYNSISDYIINYQENKLYSSNNFSILSTFQQPNFGTGVSINGQEIYGSSNNPDWSIDNSSDHKKEATIFNRQTQNTQTLTTTGYPMLIFENYLGNLISISSGMKKEKIESNINDKADLFIEIIR